MSDEVSKPTPGTVESMAIALEVTAISTLMTAMQSPDKKLGVEAAGMVLKALGKDSKAKSPESPKNILNINMLGTVKESLKGLAAVATLIGGKESAEDAEGQ